MSDMKKDLWQTLIEHDLVQGDRPTTNHLLSPWYVKSLLAFSGWVAALFLFAFIGVGFAVVIQSRIASAIVGALVIALAFAALRSPKNEFVEHLALALSLAGQGLIFVSIFKDGVFHQEITWILVAMLQIILVVLMPSFIHRVFSTFLAAYACALLLANMNVPYIFQAVIMFAIAWIWLNEFKYPKELLIIQPIGYGLTLALITLKCMILFNASTMVLQQRSGYEAFLTQPWMGEVLIGIVLLYIVWQPLQRYGYATLEPLTVLVFFAALLVCVVSIKANGIVVGMAILILGFARSNRVLLGLGVVSLLGYISLYYYLLDTNLLDKSQTLFIIALVLFLLRWVMTHKLIGKEARHAS